MIKQFESGGESIGAASGLLTQRATRRLEWSLPPLSLRTAIGRIYSPLVQTESSDVWIGGGSTDEIHNMQGKAMDKPSHKTAAYPENPESASLILDTSDELIAGPFSVSAIVNHFLFLKGM